MYNIFYATGHVRLETRQNGSGKCREEGILSLGLSYSRFSSHFLDHN
jgi:hypothetical protein